MKNTYKDILIQIVMDNGHLYRVRIMEDGEKRVLVADRLDEDEDAEICMEIAEEFSLEDNLIALRENLKLWEMINELGIKEIKEHEKENNERRSELS